MRRSNPRTKAPTMDCGADPLRSWSSSWRRLYAADFRAARAATERVPRRRTCPWMEPGGPEAARPQSTALGEPDQAIDRLGAFVEFGHERDAHEAAPGVEPLGIAPQVAAGQHGDRPLGVEALRKCCIVAWHRDPKVERRVRW